MGLIYTASPDDRVCELRTDAGWLGSGYAVAPRLVLTARHVVDRVPAGPWKVRALGRDTWLDAKILWRGWDDCDAALVVTETDLPVPAGLVDFGRFLAAGPQPFRAAGFPQTQGHKGRRDLEATTGTISPLTAYERQRLTLDLLSSTRPRGPDERSIWEGLSGAAVVSCGLVVGIVVLVKSSYADRRLEAVPSTVFLASPEFQETFAAAAGAAPSVLGVENADLPLRRPYLPLGPRPPAPSRLLLPEHGVVPFRGRVNLLADLRAWARQAAGGVSVATVTGLGGSGKSRVAAELCAQLEASLEWTTGFLFRSRGAEADRNLRAALGPLLVVVDDAEGRLDEIPEVFAMLERRAADQPTGLLLVGRGDAERWWSELREQDLNGAVERVARGLAIELTEVDEHGAGRHEAFHAAVDAFAPVLGQDAHGVQPPDLDDPSFGTVLFIHLAAMTALESQRAYDVGQPIAERLLGDALIRESGYWARTSETLGIDATVRRRAVALAALVHAVSEQHAAHLLRVLPDLSDETEGVLLKIARWLAGLYPDAGSSERWLSPLRPDILGETLVAELVLEIPELLPALLADSDLRQGAAALAILNEGSKRHPALQQPMRTALATVSTDMFLLAAHVGRDAGAPLTDLLTDILETSPDPKLALRLSLELPTESLTLRRLLRAALSQAVAMENQPPAVAPSPGDEQVVKRAFVTLRLRLAGLYGADGHWDKACEAAEAAVRCARGLTQHDSASYGQHLALALAVHSHALGAAQRTEASERAADEARTVYSNLHEDSTDVRLGEALSGVDTRIPRADRLAAIHKDTIRTFREFLASPEGTSSDDDTLQRLALSAFQGARFSYLRGDLAQALTWAGAAATAYEALTEAERDVFQESLAETFDFISTLHAANDAIQDAVAFKRRAVTAYRTLAELVPDKRATALAPALASLSAFLYASGDPSGARTVAHEASGIVQPVLADPDLSPTDTQLESYAQAVQVEALVIDREDGPEIALATAVEAWLAIPRSSNQEGQNVARLRSTLARLSHDTGRSRDAIDHADAAIGLWRQLAGADARARASELARPLLTLARAYYALKDWDHAAEAATEVVELRRALDEIAGDGFTPALAEALAVLGAALEQADRWDALEPVCDELVNLRLGFAQDGGDHECRILADTLQWAAKVSMMAGADDDAVLDLLEEAVALHRDLAVRGADDRELLVDAIKRFAMVAAIAKQEALVDKIIDTTIEALGRAGPVAVETLAACLSYRKSRAGTT